MHTRQPYSGDVRKLVLGLDVGTTYSGVSYAILEPGQVPEIKGVTRFPAQEHVGGDSKIPSILFYDEAGNVKAVGAEALQEAVAERAEDEGWTKVEWFKLHLRPKQVDTRHMKSLSLPPSISVINVYADFLRYLFQCTRRYIEETHTNGGSLWISLAGNIDYVITHPNGWEGRQQSHLRQAVVAAGLVANTMEGHKRVQLLTEGEASLHFCVQNGLGSNIAKTKEGVVIVDAGGGTVDVSAFAAKSPTSFEEISAAQCHFQGSVFVTRRARKFFEERFKGSKFSDDVATMEEVFDKMAKLRFRSEDEPSYVKFGGIRDKDPALNVRSGQLMLQGSIVANFFKPSIDAIMDAIITQRKNSHKSISLVFLVGGFAASDYLFLTLQTWLKPLGISLSRPDSHVNKAVADGAVSFYLDHFVTDRVSRFSCGAEGDIIFKPFDQEHKEREGQVYLDERGRQRLPKGFCVVLKKGTQVSESQSFSIAFRNFSYTSPTSLNEITTNIIAYGGALSPCPAWTDVDPDKFFTLCSVKADLSLVKKPMQWGYRGVFYEVNYNINIVFGPAEMSAYLSWEEDGITKKGAVEIMYEDIND